MLLTALVEKPESKNISVREVMGNSFPIVAPDNTTDTLSSMIRDHKAVLVRNQKTTR